MSVSEELLFYLCFDLLLGVFGDFGVEYFKFDACLFDDCFAFFAAVVVFQAYDAFDAGVDDHFCACVAGCHFGVDGGSFDGDSVPGGECDGVCFAVACSETVPAFSAVFVCDFFHLVSDFVAVRNADWCSDVSCGEDSFVPDDDCGGFAAVAGCSACDRVDDVEEVFVPAGAFADFSFPVFEQFVEFFVEGGDVFVVLDRDACHVYGVVELLVCGVGALFLFFAFAEFF